ncbi:hypothetical protein ACHAWF_005779 [Thalassiosira exigua]
MLPYKVRKPAWGSLKPKSAEGRDVATARLRLGGGGDPVDPHAVGGNLQRAILLDLVGLRGRHRDAEAKAAAEASAAAFDRNVDGTAAAIDPRGGGTGSRHAPPGSSFARFKACFRDARFGAMHTRTIPPRVDRGEYVQLLYSSCFHLLEGAFRRGEDDPEPPSWTEDPSRAAGSAAFDAIFAAFALYALRRTTVLPEAPPPRSRTPRTEAGRLDERSLEEAWSMLPVGVSGEEDRLHRRTFRSGVRVDRRNYLLLLRLRDVCRARVARCGADETEGATRDAEAAAAEASASWKCFCGLAADAVRVIDRMIFDDGFFQYCEYHGPHSVEGLAGSPNFYRAYFSKEAIKKKSKQPKKCSAAAPTSKSSLALSTFELNAMGGPHETLDAQHLSILVQNHRSNLSSVMGQLQKSRQYGGDLQPKQRELVDATLQGIMQPTTNYLQIAKELSGTKDSVANPNDEPSPRAQVKQAEPEVQPTGSKWDLPTFPDSFSSALCDQIRCSLLDFKDEAEKIRKAVLMESIAAVKTEPTRAFDPELSSFDGLDSSVAQEKSLPSAIPIGSDAAATISNQSKRNRHEKERGRLLEQDVLEDDDMTDKLEKKEDTSVATGAGKNALLTLLSMAEGDESIRDYEPDDEVSLATGVGKNALLSLLSMAERSDPEILDDSGSSDSGDSYSAKSSSIHDGASVESGKGKKALQHLLAQSLAKRERERGEGGDRAGQHKVVPQKRTRKTTAKRKAPAKHANPKSSKKKRTKRLREECSVSEMEDEFSLATGRGRNALSSLLAMAGERNSGPLGDESLSSCSDNSFVDDGNASTRFADASADTGGRKRETSRRIPPQATARSTSAEGPERKSLASTELPPLESSDYLEEHDEEFMNASAATGFASEDSFSVDTGDGKKALASLLAAVKRVEQV